SSDGTDENKPEGNQIDPTKVVETAKPGMLDFLTAGLANVGKKAAEKAEKVEEVKGDTETKTEPEKKEPVVTTPAKKRWRLIYRDLQGNPVMEIILDDDSPMVGSLRNTGLLELVEDGKPGVSGATGNGTPSKP